MKKLIAPSVLIFIFISAFPQNDRSQVLQNLEGNQSSARQVVRTATLKYASRLFKDKDDLTSVIMVIPADSVVEVLDSDSTYLHVVYEDNDGYIYTHQATINPEGTVPAWTAGQQQEEQPDYQTRPVQVSDRYSYLEQKYGASMASKLYEGKVWKGMSAEMVQDSWGSPRKINRLISGNDQKEEWVYRKYWLYFINGVLTDWGPVK